MKKLLLLTLFSFLLIQYSLFSQWENLNPIPDGNDLKDIFFINDDVGWIVGSGGLVMKTTNTGSKWDHKISGTDSTLHAIFFIDNNTGWCVGNGGTVLKSIDGGNTWEGLPSEVITNLNSVHFTNENNGWVVGESGEIIKTTDGGSTWESLSSGTTENLLSVHFVNDQRGFAAGGDNTYPGYSGVLLSTTDGGDTWAIQNYDYILYKIFFLDDNIGWISGRYNIYKTTNAGENWDSIYSVDPHGGQIDARFYDIYFIDQNNGYTIGIGDPNGIKKTADGGYSWYYCGGFSGYHLHGVCGPIFMSSYGKGIAVGWWGQILITEDFGNMWKVMYSGGVWDKNYMIISDMTAKNNNIIAIGLLKNHLTHFNSAILKPLQDSEYWIFDKQINDTYYLYCSITFVNDSVGYAVEDYFLHKTTDRGNTWELLYNPFNDSPSQIINSPANNYQTDIFFLDEYHGWFQYDGNLDVTTDGGDSWTNLPVIDPSGKIFFINQAIGFNNDYKTTDGGYSWTYKGGGDAKYFINDSVGFSVGANGGIWKTTDVGETWHRQNSGTNEFLNDVYFVNDNRGYVVGNGGMILATTNAGYSWHQQESGTTHGLTTIMFIDENTGYIGGYDGTILKTTNGGGTIPVELISFSASSSIGNVTLEWNTSTETNNHGFEIERSASFNASGEDTWVRIGYKEGHGTTTEPQSYSFNDDISSIKTQSLKYRLKQINYDGSYEYSKVVEVTNLSPVEFILQQNYPNPFNPVTVIKYGLPVKSNVQLKIFNSIGEEIQTLVNEEKPAGSYEVEFNASNLPSGIYFYQIKAGSFSETKKMVLLR